MKKIVLTFVFAVFATFGFAQNRFEVPSINIDECYDLSIDVSRLSNRLQLTSEQVEFMKAINDCMNREIEEASSSEGFVKAMQFRKAIDKDVRNMKKILDEEQFEIYVQLLFTTIRNNFINQLGL